MSNTPAPDTYFFFHAPISVKPKIFPCEDCPAEFERLEYLIRHSRRHIGIRPYSCQSKDCPKQFYRFDDLLQHMKIHRSSTNISKKPILFIESKESVELRDSNHKPSGPIISGPTTTTTTTTTTTVTNNSRLSVQDLCNPVDEEVVMPEGSFNSQIEFEAVNILVLMSRDNSKQ